MEQDLTFQDIKNRVEMPELLSHFGYQLKQGENLAKGKWHVFEGPQADKLVVFKGKGNDWMYFNSQDERDKGTVIDWMKNRVANGNTPNISQQPGRNLWQSVNDHFRAYLNLPEDQRPRLELAPLAPMQSSERFQNILTENARPLTDTSYLESRGIKPETLENPQFKGRIFNHLHTVQKEGLPPKTYVNTAFPAYHEGRVVGLEVKAPGVKTQVPDSEFSRSLWLSKAPEAGRTAPQLFVSESAIDSLSYAQMHPKEQNIYSSTAGVLTQNKIFEIKRILTTEMLSGVKIGFDNDVQGHHFDTRLLAGLAGDQNPMKVVREHPHILSIEVNSADKERMQQMTKQLINYNGRISEQYYQQSNGGQQPAGTQVDPTLRSELISVTKTQPNSYQFHVPMSADALSAFNQVAQQQLQFEHRIEIVKAQGKDWNQDLKEQQMQQVVKQTFGSQQSPEVGAPSTATPTPAAETADTQRLAQDRAAAASEGKRIVVVDWQQPKKEADVFKDVLAYLEKAGVTVQSRTSGQAPADTTLQSSQAQLVYQAKDEKIVTIAQALEQVGKDPRAKLQEPAGQPQERQALSEQQQVQQQQQQQASKQVVPMGSTDQARQQFVDLAGPVAKELQQQQQPLQAARLQDVSRFVLKSDTLSEREKEAMSKVFSVVAQSDVLKNSPQVQQLANAYQRIVEPSASLDQKAGQRQEQPDKKEPEQAEKAKKRGPRL